MTMTYEMKNINEEIDNITKKQTNSGVGKYNHSKEIFTRGGQQYSWQKKRICTLEE